MDFYFLLERDVMSLLFCIDDLEAVIVKSRIQYLVVEYYSLSESEFISYYRVPLYPFL